VPELPEVETVRRDLAELVAGRRVVAVTESGLRTVRRQGPGRLTERLGGRTLGEAGRRGKYLLVPLDSGEALVVHLRMSGQLRLAGSSAEPAPAHTHVRLDLDDGRQLRFVDPRTFCEVLVVDPARLAEEAPDLAALGWDPLLDPRSPQWFERFVRGRRKVLKNLLTDQHLVAGLGNIYSDEALHHARLHGTRPGASLSAREARALYRAVLVVLHDAVAARGSSLRDAQYVDLLGRPGSYQRAHQVYGRAGQPCPRCRRGVVVRTSWAGRGTWACPQCQR
jgi:formamidopyrimidine-DNA glycosylase